MKTLYLFPTHEEAVVLLAHRPELQQQVGIIGVGMAEAGAGAAALIRACGGGGNVVKYCA